MRIARGAVLGCLGAALVFPGCATAGPSGGGGEGEFRGVFGQCPGAVEGVRSRQLQRHVHVRELVLDRLERTDRATELDALFGVRHGAVEATLGAAGLLRSEQGCRALQGLLDACLGATFGAENVKFLLVHHTATPSTAGGTEVGRIRSVYSFHTGTRGWKDVCYQFFIGRTGEIWEARAGSLAGPVVADATGGSQGFAQLVCLLGDYTTRTPSPAMQDSLVKVLAWMADRYHVDTSPGATTSFVSRGSNRWRAGTTVLTPTIAGHRDMSRTGCPGDSAYALLPGLRTRVQAQRAAWATPT